MLRHPLHPGLSGLSLAGLSLAGLVLGGLVLSGCGGSPPTQSSPLRVPVIAGPDECTPATTVVRTGPAELEVQNDGAGALTLVVARASDGAELARVADIAPAESIRLPVDLGAGETLLRCSRDGLPLGAPVRLRPRG